MAKKAKGKRQDNSEQSSVSSQQENAVDAQNAEEGKRQEAQVTRQGDLGNAVTCDVQNVACETCEGEKDIKTPSPVGDCPLAAEERKDSEQLSVNSQQIAVRGAASEEGIRDKVLYQFASYPVCPRCGTRDNHATSTQGRIQYRRCDRANCRKTFKVAGDAVAAGN